MEVLIIDNCSMQTGGIEVYLAKLLEYAISTNRRVIWLTTPARELESHFPITFSNRIEKAYIRRTVFGPKYPHLETLCNDDITLITFDPCRYSISDAYRAQLNFRTFTHLLVIANFTGTGVYPEFIFRNKTIRNYWHRKMKVLASSLVSRNCVRGFAQKHLTTYASIYDLSASELSEKTVGGINKPMPATKDEIISRDNKRPSSFEIITCARFEFPHKGYLLGLIRAFEQIHNHFPRTKLVIVGYGPGQAEVDKAIEELSPDVAKSIELTGRLSPEELENRYRSAQLNIGLAGSLTKGAQCSLPSIKMEHYTYECEGYGFIEDTVGLRPDQPATNMIDLIESVVTMSSDDYMAHSIAAFNSVSNVKYDPEYFFRQKEAASSSGLPISVASARLLFFLRLFTRRVFHRSSGEEIEL